MKNSKLSLAKLIIVGLLAFAVFSPVQAGLYKCTDKNGRTHYQDKPCQELATTRLPTWMNSIAGREEERAFLWKAVGDKGTVYLLGSPRYGEHTFYPFTQMVIDALNNSQQVLVEADLWNISEKERDVLLKNHGRYEHKNEALDEHVKPVTWLKVKDMGKKLGLNEEMLRTYKPWRAALILTSEALKQAGFTADLSVSQTILKDSLGKKPVEDIGSRNEVVATLEGLSDREQEQLLLQTLQEVGRAPEIYKNIADAWRKGDAEAMDQLLKQIHDPTNDDVSAKLFKVLYEEGNEKIADLLKKRATAEDKTLFVVVDAERLGGDSGILKLLQDKKFTVTQP
jgi:hypothetical protein